VDEAEMILQLVDELQRLLWEAYYDAILDNSHASDPPPASHGGGAGPDL